MLELPNPNTSHVFAIVETSRSQHLHWFVDLHQKMISPDLLSMLCWYLYKMLFKVF